MTIPEISNPVNDNMAGDKPDEFNESAPIQPGTEVEPNTPDESPAAPTPLPAIPDAPFDQGADLDPNDRVQSQDDEDAQAQTVAVDAIRAYADQADGEDSEHGGSTNPAQIIPDDAQDVVDHMQQMQRSGQIDMSAFDGERNDDDETDMLGEGGMEPGDLDEHGNPARETGGYTGVE